MISKLLKLIVRLWREDEYGRETPTTPATSTGGAYPGGNHDT